MPGPLLSEHVIRTDAPADDPARHPTPHSAELWGILKPLAGIWKAADLPRRRILETFRRQKFLFQARMEGGAVELAASARFYGPIRFDGQGKLMIGEAVTLGWPPGGMPESSVLLQPREKDSALFIGDGSLIMNGCEIIARQSIRIGKKCLIGAGVVMYDSNFHTLDPRRRTEPDTPEPVVIEDNVWIGRGAVILKGARVGRDAVIGAQCVVTKNVPAGAIVVGNPMQPVSSVYAEGGARR